MAKKPRNLAPPDSQRSEVDRIRHLLENHWGGNQNEMARAIGCSQSSLSRVFSGASRPGKRVLKLIADHAEVNSEWLYHGRGEPLVDKSELRTTADLRLPVTSHLLPGPPTDHPDRFDGTEFPVAATLYRPTRCWYEVPGNAAVLRNKEACLQFCDLLLLDYDTRQFDNLFEVNGKIAVAWVESRVRREDRRLELGILEYYCEVDDEMLLLVTGEPPYTPPKNLKRLRCRITTKDTATSEDVVVGTPELPVLVDRGGRPKQVADVTNEPVSYRIYHPSDLVAVCVGMFRQ